MGSVEQQLIPSPDDLSIYNAGAVVRASGVSSDEDGHSGAVLAQRNQLHDDEDFAKLSDLLVERTWHPNRSTTTNDLISPCLSASSWQLC